MSGYRTGSGRKLQREWGIPARQVRFHKDGEFYMPPELFPAALADPNGYLLIASAEEYARLPWASRSVRLNLTRPVSRFPGYVRAR